MLNNPHVHHNLKSEVLELHERSTDLNRELSWFRSSAIHIRLCYVSDAVQSSFSYRWCWQPCADFCFSPVPGSTNILSTSAWNVSKQSTYPKKLKILQISVITQPDQMFIGGKDILRCAISDFFVQTCRFKGPQSVYTHKKSHWHLNVDVCTPNL